MTIPSGWMTADEARKWARRGVWAFRYGDGAVGVYAYDCDEAIGSKRSRASILAWRYIGPHPDDEPADVSGMVGLEAWVTIGCDSDGGQVGTSVCGSRHAAESEASHARMAGRAAKVVRLTGYTAPPIPEAVETVAGVTS